MDSTVVLRVLFCALFVWFLRKFCGWCRQYDLSVREEFRLLGYGIGASLTGYVIFFFAMQKIVTMIGGDERDALSLGHLTAIVFVAHLFIRLREHFCRDWLLWERLHKRGEELQEQRDRWGTTTWTPTEEPVEDDDDRP